MNITVLSWEDVTDSFEEVADSDHSKGYPGVAGYVGNADVYCNECVPSEYEESDRAILTTSAWDYPGTSCCVCFKRLDTSVLVYEKGPGRELFD